MLINVIGTLENLTELNKQIVELISQGSVVTKSKKMYCYTAASTLNECKKALY